MSGRKKPLLVWLRNRVRDGLVVLRRMYFLNVHGMSIGSGTVISLKASLDKANPRGVHIGDNSYIAAEAMILSHDFINRRHLNTTIGSNVFIGAKAIILPGVRVADNVIVAAGSVVNRSIEESGVIVAGNPASVVKHGVDIARFGQKSV